MTTSIHTDNEEHEEHEEHKENMNNLRFLLNLTDIGMESDEKDRLFYLLLLTRSHRKEGKSDEFIRQKYKLTDVMYQGLLKYC